MVSAETVKLSGPRASSIRNDGSRRVPHKSMRAQEAWWPIRQLGEATSLGPVWLRRRAAEVPTPGRREKWSINEGADCTGHFHLDLFEIISMV